MLMADLDPWLELTKRFLRKYVVDAHRAGKGN